MFLSLLVGLGLSTWLFFREREAHHEQMILREKAENAEQRAEAREKINQAAIYVHQGKFDDASKLLGEVKSPLPKPSFDGILAYRTVGEWLALHGRWDESAARYLGLMEIDKLDPWGAVTLDYQACGVVLVESGEFDRYELFCGATVVGFATTTNEHNYDKMKEKIMDEAKRLFRPEFLNRLDDAIVFRALTKLELVEVLVLEVSKVTQRLKGRQLQLNLDDAAKDFLLQKGYDPTNGARPMRRAVERNLEDPLAEEILKGGLLPNEPILVTVQDGKLVFRQKTPAAAAATPAPAEPLSS